MKINKIINNNVVSAFDENGKEIVIMGKGIGFGQKEGRILESDKIEKIFRIESENTFDRFKSILENLPLEYIQISDDVIAYAKNVLNKELNQNIYLTLTDHINFAIERSKQGMQYENALRWDVSRFYQDEYKIGIYAIDLIEKVIGIRLTEDEAASVALHILNAEYDVSMHTTIDIAHLIQKSLDFVRRMFQIDEKSDYYERFISYMKFLAHCIISNKKNTCDEQAFQSAIKELYPQQYACSCIITNYIEEVYHYQVSGEDQLCIALHIKRITK